MGALLATLVRKSNGNANRTPSGGENYVTPISMGAFRSSTACGKLQPVVTLAINELVLY